MSEHAADLRPARPADFGAVSSLLAAHHLPLDGIARSLDGFLVAEAAGALVGVIALERYGGHYGLLRSAAVAPGWQSRGLGRRLVDTLISDATKAGVDEIYLLTDTAERYFPKFGFAPTTRDQVPAEVRASVEFTTACPESAIVMVRRG